MQRHFHLKLLVAAISIGCATAISAATPTSVANPGAFVALAQHATVLRTGDVANGAVAAAQPMHIAVALKLRNATQLHNFIATAKTSSLAIVQRTMSSA